MAHPRLADDPLPPEGDQTVWVRLVSNSAGAHTVRANWPSRELSRIGYSRRATSWLVSRPESAAEAIVDAGLHGTAERYVPRPWALAVAARALVPGLLRRLESGGGGQLFLTKTGAEREADAAS